MNLSRRLPASLATAALICGALASCSSTDGPDGRPDIDARAYYEDYAEGTSEMSRSAPNATSQPLSDSASTEPPIPAEPPRPDEDNTFEDEGTSGFVDPRRDPASTFALDVDTGSFGVAGTLLRGGYRVPPESIRAEEWINAQTYADPAPTDRDLALTTESGMAPSLDDGTQVVRVGVQAREVAAEERPRVNLTMVVDTSGSMDIRERLGLVKSSLAIVARELRDDDTVSVVTFEDRAVTHLEPTPVRQTDRIIEAIEELRPGGSTNLEGGLRLGYEQAREVFDPDATNLVLLASDGVANVGQTGPGSISERIAEEGADGINLVTVGYGMGNFNDHLMEQVANLGDGFYSYVDTYEEAEQLFAEDLLTTLVPVAAEARVQVDFDPEVVESYRLIGYENREIRDEDFEDLAVDAGELGSGHHATAVYEVALTDGVAAGETIAMATAIWRSVESGDAERAEIPLVAADPQGEPSADLQLATLAADVAQFLKQSQPYAGRGEDSAVLRARAAELAGGGVADAEVLAELLEEAESAR